MSEAIPGTDAFIETLEYRRFAEFCDACRQYRYIGLCYGSPGVGKTLSARQYAGWDALEKVDRYRLSDAELLALGAPDTVFYTPGVINTPRTIKEEVDRWRSFLHYIAREPLSRKQSALLDRLGAEHKRAREEYFQKVNWFDPDRPDPPPGPEYARLAHEFVDKEAAISDPTNLILIDEADRLKMASLEATRDLFDRGSFGLVLIGMPGIEKRMARYPQLYSRIGFVHEFRPLSVAEVRRLLGERWRPPGVTLGPMDEESVAMIVRITGGNFRLLHRLLAQAERVAQINELEAITSQVVDAARESLVIGQM